MSHARVLVLAGAAACVVGPNFQRPAAPGVGRYTGGPGVGRTITADGVAQVVHPGAELAAAWWQLFHSRALDGVVAEALAGNANLEAARANLRRSRYSLAAGYSVFYPQLDANAGATRERFSSRQFGLSTPGSVFNLYTLAGTVSYTVDVFGGNRRRVEALRAQVDVECYSLATARLTLTGNVVNTVIARAGYGAEIRATEQLVDSLGQQVAIAEAQARAGTAPYTTVLSLRSQQALERATLPPLRNRLAQADDLLATLVGRAPAAWHAPAIELADLALPRELPVSLPAELVRQRPDVLVAEANLHVASANIGVATAALLPGLTLNGSIGVNANTLSTLFSYASLFWSIGGNLTAPIFHGGALRNQRKAAIEAYRQALASYRQTVLGAFGDVANALSALELDAELVDDESRALDAATQSRKLLEANYASGLVDYLQVLVAEDQYLQAKIGHIQAQTQRLQDTVALFVALGGGWWSQRASVCDP